ncbi:aspartate dehydrogenase [Parathalassolituus penaei]|uniref:L-aspartate dehydrogenase n=1 Tax=Parathalassolituus penaei TaxID=2997323 RepID=A0A9X3ISL9_9GAMM|nr:aspartate dehydrogenase [Parathalassolituus penaei]MCY0965390.1 aspartate dehydrogenase [Parathalassolituus penaei]
MKQLMLIGFGAMAEEVLAHMPAELVLRWVVVTERSRNRVRALLPPSVAVVTRIAECTGKPDLVLECAGQPGVRAHGVDVLARGWDLAVISVGALADAELADRLHAAAATGRSRLHALSGAVAGIDGLAAAREGGLDEVLYTSRKSPASWRGSAAEQMVCLDTIAEPYVFFRGSAREAALAFPANANVAATIALAGLGLDKTRVQLMVDPGISTNQHRIHASGRFGEMNIELCGMPLERNPKTSTLAALSVVRACRQAVSSVVI